ncbi:hypothetical protein DFJ68_0906 [Terracoccus luteus]|uniref:Transcriptional regulator, AbiEi antitoxin, Type IV TA system n=1 Tax=Terracoccus luteus TaxID=53356 RepID=A0A495XYB5_9MICO|nr:hypothetical protein [Terracoccus luteus]RKT77483.1 hypothetical protein DFJ68_0906 [Terracoccus luteus]
MELPDHLASLADEQWGVLTRRQLVDGGVSPAMVRWRVGHRWRALLPGVLLMSPGLPSDEQRLVAALLAAGPESWLSGTTAAMRHGLVPPGPLAPVQVMVPFPARSRRIGWVTVRATALTDERLLAQGPLRLACRPRALVDAAAQAPDDDAATAMIIRAVQERLVRVDDVQHWVGVRRRNGTVRLKKALAAAATGAWSVPEAELGALLRRSGRFPQLMANPALEDENSRPLTTPDLWLDEVALAVMVHSRRFHAGALDWDATVDGDEDLRECTIEVVGVTPNAITRHPDKVVARVLAARERAARRPRPPVTATPRDWAARLAGAPHDVPADHPAHQQADQ